MLALYINILPNQKAMGSILELANLINMDCNQEKPTAKSITLTLQVVISAILPACVMTENSQKFLVSGKQALSPLIAEKEF